MEVRTMATDALELLDAVLNEVCPGVLLASRDGVVMYMNAAAKRQVRLGGALTIVNNRLRPTDTAAASRLGAALKQTTDPGAHAGRQAVALALPDRGGSGFVATVLPLRSAASAPLAIIFIQDPNALLLFPAEAFAKLYGLTNGEMRVTLVMTQGATAPHIAGSLGISTQTVRTHLKHIFQKTGTSRQADLLTLMSRAATLADRAPAAHCREVPG